MNSNPARGGTKSQRHTEPFHVLPWTRPRMIGAIEDPFFLKLLLAFGVGGLMVTLATVAAERLGSKMGGLVGGLPTMVATSLFFIGYAQTPQTASDATSTIPLIMGFNGIFLVIYVILAKKGAWVGMLGALVLWFALAWAVLFLRIDSFATSLLIFILSLIGTYHLLENRFRLPSTGRLSIRYTPFQIISRALFSGSVVSAAVYLSKVGGPIWGGVVAPFPTVYISTLIIMAKSKGAEFSRRIAKSLLVSGMINVVVYASAVRFLYPLFNLALGTLLSLAITAASAYGTYWFMKNKMR
jgi:uncharacterized membrane protein (GlpM family)